jgi:hypothetical protein
MEKTMLRNRLARPGAAIALAVGCCTSLALPARGSDLLSGEWVGTYTCYQGLTALTLTIEPDGEQWAGIFAFGPDKRNKSVPRGSYELVITQDEAGIHMVPGPWIEQPERYGAVALNGTLSDNLMTLSGDVHFEGCTEFTTTRTTPLPAPASKTK